MYFQHLCGAPFLSPLSPLSLSPPYSLPPSLRPSLSPLSLPPFHFSLSSPLQLLFAHATESRIYYTLDEGLTFSTREITAVDINPRTIQYHPTQDGWMMALDTSNAVMHARTHTHTHTRCSVHYTYIFLLEPRTLIYIFPCTCV